MHFLNQMLNNTTSSSETKQVQNLQNIVTNTGKKRSKHTYIIQPKTSRRKINNNIKEKLFQSKLNAYKSKQDELLRNFEELNRIYRKCTELSKMVSQPKNKYLEDIERVVNYQKMIFKMGGHFLSGFSVYRYVLMVNHQTYRY